MNKSLKTIVKLEKEKISAVPISTSLNKIGPCESEAEYIRFSSG
jgi:hypothetical protein